MPLSLRDSATAAVKALQKWYGADSFAASTGLYHWDDPGLGGFNLIGFGLSLAGQLYAVEDMERWWNSANAITALIDYMSITKDLTYLSVLENTFTNAQKGYTVSTVGVVAGGVTGGAIGSAAGWVIAGPVGAVIGGLFGTALGAGAAAATYARNYNTNFFNEFYDDEGWWALAWIKAYDLTKDRKYLDMAATIQIDMSAGWDDVCSGGLWWGKSHDTPSGWNASVYKNAITNELYLAISAALYLRFKAFYPSGPVPPTVQDFLNIAHMEWQWFNNSGLINRRNLINDALLPACVNEETLPVWTYTQGVILSGLCDMSEITGDPSYRMRAEQIADALIQNPVAVPSGGTPESGINLAGILTEWTDPYPAIDHCQFKGIFIRNLAYLASKDRFPRYRAFILKNAASALNTMNSANQFGSSWSAPIDTVDFVRQSAALDLLNAAMTVQYAVTNGSYVDILLLDEKRAGIDVSYLDPLLLNNEQAEDVSYLDPLLKHD